jgi:hypothetical protein
MTKLIVAFRNFAKALKNSNKPGGKFWVNSHTPHPTFMIANILWVGGTVI